MTSTTLKTDDEGVVLMPIDLERDAPLGVQWLHGQTGRDTLRKMGVTDEYNHESTLAAERQRLQTIIDDPHELAWMIALNGQVVGITETHLHEFESLSGPNIHIMIGDPAARGHGVGTAVLQAVLNHLQDELKFKTVYSRHLTSNNESAALLRKLGFSNLDAVYHDADGLTWQNMIRRSTDG